MVYLSENNGEPHDINIILRSLYSSKTRQSLKIIYFWGSQLKNQVSFNEKKNNDKKINI